MTVSSDFSREQLEFITYVLSWAIIAPSTLFDVCSTGFFWEILQTRLLLLLRRIHPDVFFHIRSDSSFFFIVLSCVMTSVSCILFLTPCTLLWSKPFKCRKLFSFSAPCLAILHGPILLSEKGCEYAVILYPREPGPEPLELGIMRF
jgi:hypothetical protein